jgi:branched-chain amino acid transport system substrate-binding protein
MKTSFAGSFIAIAAVCALAAPAVAEVKLGSLSAVTGPIPELVADIVDAERAAVADINANGGVLGDTLSLVVADSQCDAKAAVDAANKLVNVEQVVAIAGAICSGGTIGAAEAVTVPAGMVSISPSATSPAITGLDDNDLVFRTAPSDAYQGVALAGLARSMGYDKIAVTYANDDYNAGLGKVFIDAFKAAGGTVTAEQVHEPKKPSYRSELATLSGGGAEALALFAYYDGSGLTILRQSLEGDLFGKFIGADGMMADTVIAELGADNLAGNLVATTPTSDEEAGSYKAYAAIFSAAGGKPAAPFAAQAYDAVMLLALAIQHSGGTDRAGILSSLRAVAGPPGAVVGPGDWAEAVTLIAAGKDINYEGAAGSADFDENGDVSGRYRKNEVGLDGMWHGTPIE